jgi:uncharacterized protein
VADAVLTLYQSEWCPFSSAVREVLTELGIDFVARQVEPWPEQRHGLRELAGTDQTPVLQAEDGELLAGTRAIFAHLRERDPWRFAAAHRRRFEQHHDARVSDVAAQLVDHFHAEDEPSAGAEVPADAEVVDVPEENRFELRLDGHRVGHVAYRRRNGRIVFTHTVVEPSYEGRGFGSVLAAAALRSAEEERLQVVPLCPFISGYIARHPEYERLVAPGYRDR